jgi:transposase
VTQGIGTEIRKPYPGDLTDDAWAFVTPYLALMREDAGQRAHPLCEGFNGLGYKVKTGGRWRWMPHDLPPWPMV